MRFECDSTCCMYFCLEESQNDWSRWKGYKITRTTDVHISALTNRFSKWLHIHMQMPINCDWPLRVKHSLHFTWRTLSKTIAKKNSSIWRHQNQKYGWNTAKFLFRMNFVNYHLQAIWQRHMRRKQNTPRTKRKINTISTKTLYLRQAKYLNCSQKATKSVLRRLLSADGDIRQLIYAAVQPNDEIAPIFVFTHFFFLL